MIPKPGTEPLAASGLSGNRVICFLTVYSAGHHRIIVEPVQCSSKELEPRDSWLALKG